MNGNLGATKIRKRKRTGHPMSTFDTLPPQLRRCLSDAHLPWSPKSAGQIWQRAQSKGMSVDETLKLLDRYQEKTIAPVREQNYSVANSNERPAITVDKH